MAHTWMWLSGKDVINIYVCDSMQKEMILGSVLATWMNYLIRILSFFRVSSGWFVRVFLEGHFNSYFISIFLKFQYFWKFSAKNFFQISSISPKNFPKNQNSSHNSNYNTKTPKFKTKTETHPKKICTRWYE